MAKTAMIDVGGGFRAIFGCGVMDRMLEDGIDVDMCYGVSAGAANMTSFIARQHGRNHTFYTKYAFRKEYASAESYFKNHNFANLDYIYGTLSNQPVSSNALTPPRLKSCACGTRPITTKSRWPNSMRQKAAC